MGVLGGPVNKVLPNLPGTKIQLTVGSLMPSMANSAGWSPLGKSVTKMELMTTVVLFMSPLTWF